jgi:hypothetical protein
VAGGVVCSSGDLMPFEVSFGDQKWRTDDLTLDEAISIEKVTGRSWMQVNPFVSAEDCKAIMVAFLAREMDPQAAEAKVGGLSLGEVLDSIKHVKDDLPDEYVEGLPKGEGGPSTGGSSGVPDDSDGRPT